MTSALSQSSRGTFYLVRFLYGEASSSYPVGTQEARYTDSPSILQGPGGAYTPSLSMEIKIPKLTGQVKGSEAKITLPADSFTNPLSDGTSHSPTYCFIYEQHEPITTGSDRLQLCVFSGPVDRATAAPDGKNGLVQIIAVGLKGTFNIPLGLFEEHHCVWPLYSGPCGISKVLFDLSLTVDTVGHNRVTMFTNASLLLKKDGWFTRGWLEYEGNPISIRLWQEARPLVFHLVRDAPASWDGRSVKAYAGCNKTPEQCADRFNNESEHGGIGVGIPSFNPLYERGDI